MRIARFAALAMSAALLAGCGKLGKGQIEDALNESFGGSVCWAVEDMAKVSFPIRIGYDPTATQGNAILKGLGEQRLISIAERDLSGDTYGFFSSPGLEIDLTDAGRKAGVWDAEKGFCIGDKRVVEVVRFSEPAEEGGMQVTQVEYTWEIARHPSWLDEKAFDDMPGVGEPQDGTAVLRKMDDGWRVLAL